jgi:tetratricopeptide (TPR) repeat protein
LAFESYQSGDLVAAQRLVQKLLQGDEGQADWWALASDIALHQGRTRDAIIAADRAVRLEPGNPPLHVRSARCHIIVGDVTAARREVDAALSGGACTADQLAVLASVLFHCDDHPRALTLYLRATALEPTHLEGLRGLALVHRALGRITDAESAADQVLARHPDDHEIWHLRSTLRRQTAASNHVDHLQGILTRGIAHWRGTVQVSYALAKELEDLGRYEESFAELRKAATLKRRHTNYNLRQDVQMLREIRAAFDRATIESGAGKGHASREPIFVLGLPRTGSTLVERILSNHPDVESAGEINNFALELVKLATEHHGGRPVQKERLPLTSTRLNMQALGRNYVAGTRPRTGNKRHFIDKMPMNALYVGLIHLSLPNAKIVLVERGAADNCYAMYKFLFKNAYPYSYDLEEVATYYIAHQELMRHWRSVLPEGRLCHIRYEDLVSNQEAESRRLLHELGLHWDDACLDFERNAVATTTGSAAQVRQPIYRSSVGLWRHYMRQLDPLLRVLAAGGVKVSMNPVAEPSERE